MQPARQQPHLPCNSSGEPCWLHMQDLSTTALFGNWCRRPDSSLAFSCNPKSASHSLLARSFFRGYRESGCPPPGWCPEKDPRSNASSLHTSAHILNPAVVQRIIKLNPHLATPYTKSMGTFFLSFFQGPTHPERCAGAQP